MLVVAYDPDLSAGLHGSPCCGNGEAKVDVYSRGCQALTDILLNDVEARMPAFERHFR